MQDITQYFLRTQERYDSERAKIVNDLENPYVTPDLIFTCDDCGARLECEFALDLYNTDGDCLASK